MTTSEQEREKGPPDAAGADRTLLLDAVSEASRLVRSRALDARRAGRNMLLRISAEHGHAEVAAAQAQLGLLPEGHMAYWR